MERKIIPGDDILEYYGRAPQALKMAVSDLLEGDVESYVCLKLNEEHVLTSSLHCSAITGQMMLASVLRNLTKDYGRIWLLRLLEELQRVV